MTAPENMFRTFKSRAPPTTTLTTLREWASGNENELFTHDNNHAEVEVGKVHPHLLNGQIIFGKIYDAFC